MFKNAKAMLYTLLVSTITFGAVSANAESSKEFKVMTGYVSSTAILEGDYQEAVRLAQLPVENDSLYERAVNANSLCVAYAKLADVEEATNACSKAVRLSKRVGIHTGLDLAAQNNRKIVRKYARMTK